MQSKQPGRIIFALSILLFCVSDNSARIDDLDNIAFRGVVRDIAGDVITGATITARSLLTGLERSAMTDSEGHYRLLVTEPGDYSLKVSSPGFRDEEVKTIAAASGKTITIDFSLAVEGASEEMVVKHSSTPLIDTTKTVVGDSLTQAEIDSLPILSRNPLDLVFLLGGVAEAPLSTAGLADEGRGVFLRGTPEEAGSFSLTGAPATSNNITIDGLDNNDDRTARERIALNPEAIAEVQVITNQYAAEYGRASGGRVNIRTRGGSRGLRAEGSFFFGDESLNANTFFRNARGLSRVPQQQRRANALVSGPARKKKSFFLMSYERFDVTDSVEVRAFVPVEINPLFPLPAPNHPPEAGSKVALLLDELSTPESSNLFNARLDFNFSESHNLTVRFDTLRGENKRGFPGGARLPEALLIEGRDSDSVSVSDNLVISPRAINQARFQFSRLLPRNNAARESVGVIIEEPSRVIAGTFTGSDSAPAFAREEKRAQFQNNLSFTTGSHVLKIGGDFQLVRSTFADLFATGGQFTFESVEDFLASRPARFIQRYNTESHLSNPVVGMFLQDEWKIKPNFTLSVGLRWDSEAIVNDRDNFSPRIAFAWDPFGGKQADSSARLKASGKIVVRAGFGLFYNRALLRTIDDFTLGESSLLVDSNIRREVLSLVRFPNSLADENVINRYAVPELEFLRRVGDGLEIPYTLQTGLGIERQVNSRLVTSADYIFTRGAHLWRESNVNAPVLPGGFASFTEFLLSRDFDNRAGFNGSRPIASASADVVRFDLSANTSSTPGAIKTENGLRVLVLGLNAPRSSNVQAALSAIRFLRPDPSLTQVEQLESAGNSFYHGGIFSVKYLAGARAHFRLAYTLSKLIDEGTTNTASPQDLNDRRAERALSLQDQRHRISFSGHFQVPYLRIDLAPILSFGSSRPFNIGSGVDRNLNDIENDRPNLLKATGPPKWREPGRAAVDDVKESLGLAPIGSNGNLPRNYGRGPGSRVINLRASRTFELGERAKLRTAIDVFNILNSTVFNFGSEFINRDDADFLVPRRTQRPRTVLLSLRLSY